MGWCPKGERSKIASRRFPKPISISSPRGVAEDYCAAIIRPTVSQRAGGALQQFGGDLCIQANDADNSTHPKRRFRGPLPTILRESAALSPFVATESCFQSVIFTVTRLPAKLGPTTAVRATCLSQLKSRERNIPFSRICRLLFVEIRIPA